MKEEDEKEEKGKDQRRKKKKIIKRKEEEEKSDKEEKKEEGLIFPTNPNFRIIIRNVDKSVQGKGSSSSEVSEFSQSKEEKQKSNNLQGSINKEKKISYSVSYIDSLYYFSSSSDNNGNSLKKEIELRGKK